MKYSKNTSVSKGTGLTPSLVYLVLPDGKMIELPPEMLTFILMHTTSQKILSNLQDDPYLMVSYLTLPIVTAKSRNTIKRLAKRQQHLIPLQDFILVSNPNLPSTVKKTVMQSRSV